ncbi:MAG: hypothetical protein ACSLE4_05135 [Methyloceanibacter sp.]|uniref:hypothetical protein n=1 Tax=Methyloceanibacter sp. TaxID=1965321 RepID=UPI003EE31487
MFGVLLMMAPPSQELEPPAVAPQWPCLMRAETARRYLDLGPEVFRREIVRRLPAVVLGGRRHYDKSDLDSWIELKLGRSGADKEKDWLKHIDGND